MRESFMGLTEYFGRSLIGLYESDGQYALRREEVQIMLGFVRAEIVLFTDLAFKDCADLFLLYNALPGEMRAPEAIRLAEIFLRTDIDAGFVTGMRESLIEPTMTMIADNPDETIDFARDIPRVLYALAQNHFQFLVDGDIDFLLDLLHSENHVAVFETIKALDCCIEKADMKLIEEPRDEFFRAVLVKVTSQLLVVLCDASHRFCAGELTALIRKICDFVGSGKLRVQLFPDAENIEGLSACLAERIVLEFPLVTIPEMVDLMALLLAPRDLDSFEDLIAQFIARARQTTPGETLRHLRQQRFKESLADLVIQTDDQSQG
jgi:hypothetical protein